jgi:hypothetical protein
MVRFNAGALVCTEPDGGTLPAYAISGPSGFGSGFVFKLGGSSVSGHFTNLVGNANNFLLIYRPPLALQSSAVQRSMARLSHPSASPKLSAYSAPGL